MTSALVSTFGKAFSILGSPASIAFSHYVVFSAVKKKIEYFP